jgi:xylulokinase
MKMVKTVGLELSTQSAKIIVLDSEKGVVYKKKFEYEERFPSYGTDGGVLPSDTGERHTSPAMLTEAVEECFKQMKIDDVDLSDVKFIKLDGMQHCSVYTGPGLEAALMRSGTDARFPLVGYVRGSFTRNTSPIWEDRTTTAQCKKLTDILAPSGGIVNLTGNKAEERFPAAQIMKWIKEHPEEYTRTTHIQLLSAFATSLLTGQIAPVDTGDGWGTNLNTLDINSPAFNSITANTIETHLGLQKSGHLFETLGKMVPYDTVVEEINPFFVHKYGVNPEAKVLAGTGDNPATLLGCGGGLFLSLGSSYTLNGVQEQVQPSNGEDNVFGYIPGKSMSLVCFTNGGKLHDNFVRKYVLGNEEDERKLTAEDWAKYEEIATKEGFGQHLMLPYLLAESVPVAPAGIKREGFDDKDAAKNISALYFSQMAALRAHSRHMQPPNEIAIVAGGGKSTVMRQLAANVFNKKTYTIEDQDYAAPLGCAMAAMRHALGCSYEEIASKFVQRKPGSVATPDPVVVERLKPAVAAYERFEKAA